MIYLAMDRRTNLLRRGCLALAVLLIAALAEATASGDRVSELREAGQAAFQARRYEAAKKAFDEAFSLSKLHSIGLWAARSRAELGELIEATVHLNHLTKMPLPEEAPTEERQAKQQALRLWNELRDKIPRLRISVVGVEPGQVQVTVDGKAVPPSFLEKKKKGPFRRGKSLELNPGKHHVVGVYSSELKRAAWVTLQPGQKREISLKFPNPDTLRQRKCRDSCQQDCGGDNSCYVECKRKCFTKKKGE